ncbi:MAG TPA: cytochrome c [Candidatus Binatia bacterium]|jgi:mono/diheme cytochrome c family protein|nr:cytochrome c [Candidatus Binatia bacterium]
MMKKIAFSIGSLLLAALSQSSTGWAQDQAEGKKLYASYCSSCHGEQGKGDGMAARSLPIKPKDHTDGATMNRLTDQNLADTISKGGAAVGKSSFMPGWGGSLNEKQIRDIVAYMRTLAVPPSKQ